MMPVDTDTLAARSREELLWRSLCDSESSVECLLYNEDRDALPNVMFAQRGDGYFFLRNFL
jgi:hypothetical protein